MSPKDRARMKILTRRLAALKKEEAKQQAQQSSLHFSMALLGSLCASFSLIAGQGSHADGLLEQLPGTADLLQALPAPPQEEEGLRRAAPRNNPLGLLSKLLALAPAADADNIGVAEVAGMWRTAILEASLQLHLAASTGASPEEIAQCMEAIFHRVLHMGLSLILCGRQDIILGLMSFRLDTLQPDADGLCTHTELLHRLPHQLGLTWLQLADISAGVQVFASILQDILAQQQQLVGTQEPGSSNGGSSNGSSSNGSNSSSSSTDSPMTIISLDAGLEAQSQRTARMQVLLRKDSMVRAAATAWGIGCLSWEQYAKANILYWPQVLPVMPLMQEIARSHQRQQEGQGKRASGGKGEP